MGPVDQHERHRDAASPAGSARAEPDPASDACLVSVVVPVRDDAPSMRGLLERLAAQTVPADRFEIVVGDDGSEEGSLAWVAAPDGSIRVVSGPPQTSYAARNRAVRAARGSVLAFCDSDCLPQPTWLEEGLAALENADLAAGEVVFAPPPRPSLWSLLTIDMFLDQERNVLLSRAVTANLFVRRELFEEIGGFDESLPSGGDYDLTRRAVERGARLVYAPRAIIRHPTLDASRAFLRKVWTTNRWAAYRRARDGHRPDLGAILTFVPFVGVGLARRHALRPLLRLQHQRLLAAGLAPSWHADLRGLTVIYLVVAYVAGFGRLKGWLEWRAARNRPVVAVHPESAATERAAE